MKPVVFTNDNVVYCDVDDTLVIWDYPIELELYDAIEFNNYGYKQLLLPNYNNIQSLKEFKLRGALVVVWSQSGGAWANEVVKKLQLEDVVDLVISKPKWLIDDLPASEFMPKSFNKKVV